MSGEYLVLALRKLNNHANEIVTLCFVNEKEVYHTLSAWSGVSAEKAAIFAVRLRKPHRLQQDGRVFVENINNETNWNVHKRKKEWIHTGCEQ